MGMSSTSNLSLVLYADDVPRGGVLAHGPHQRYVNPRLVLEARTLEGIAHGYIRVAPIYVGLCGTDLHLATAGDDGYVQSSAPALIPTQGRVIGHEGVARVIDLSPDVKGLSVGDIVCMESIVVCHHCVPCRRGEFNQCESARLIGTELDGLFAGATDVPASVVHKVSQNCSDEDLQALACLEPAGVALLACQKAKVAAGDSVLIFGGGPIGHYCAMLSRVLFGASRVVLVEPVLSRRELAKAWCDDVIDTADLDSHEKPDVVIEASGFMENINRIFTQIKANGRVILLARSGASLSVHAVDHMITKSILIQGARGHVGGYFDQLLSLHFSGRINLRSAITKIVPSLHDLSELMKRPKNFVDEHCKVLVKL